MENYDPALAARVWQRVRAGEGAVPDAAGLLPLIAEEWSNAAVYLQLSHGRKNTPAGAALHRLSEQNQSHAACLKGIYTLSTGRKALVQTPAPGRENPEPALRRCYARTLRMLQEYERRASDPDYGPVFARLAAQKKDQCQTILSLVGMEK